MKFIIFSQFGELLDLAMQLQEEKNEVEMFISYTEDRNIGEGIIKKQKDWWRCIGQDYIWVFDGCEYGDLQDWLREKGELVFGGSKIGDQLENDRQLNQEWFAAAGFNQPHSQNFTNIDEAIKFIQEHPETKYILKQNGDAPKHLNHKSQFDGGFDMLYHLKELKRRWNESEYGKVDFDLMEIIEGLEVAASCFFNGQDYLKNAEGEVAGFLNFEEKKETDNQLGETTGEMGTTFIGVTESNKLFKSILIRPKILEVLRTSKFRGIFDINCIVNEQGVTALEPTMRLGIPATSYEFMEGLLSPSTTDIIEGVARGKDIPIEIREGVGMVMVVAAKPYPIEAEVERELTSVGEKLWILDNGKPIDDFTLEQKKHIRLENFEKTVDEEIQEICYKVATKNGYLLVVSGSGKTIPEVRENLIKYINNNIYIAGMKYRSDIGQRAEEYL